MTIPIRNLYYLFCYAWARFPPGDAIDVGVDECPDLQNLFARLLLDGGRRVTRRGLERGYSTYLSDLRAPRGRIQFEEMAKRQTLTSGIVVCTYDELSHDVLHNQILKATARLLARVDTIDPDTAHGLLVLARAMGDVSDIKLSPAVFRRVQLGRNNGQYGLLMHLCEFVFRSVLPSSGGTRARFANVLEEEARMSAVFEDFVRNFYRFEQVTYKVGREVLTWDATAEATGDLRHIPVMLTDVTLRSPDETLIVDAKYYKEMLVSYRGTEKVRSSHLYQMTAYLRHAARLDTGKAVRGALVYPASDGRKSLRYSIEGFTVQLEAIDLMQSWAEIKSQLLDLIAHPTKRHASHRSSHPIDDD